MIYYVPSSAAENLSIALWELSRPASLQQQGDTTMMFGWIDDTQGNRWLEVHDDFSIIIHPEAELGNIAGILQPFIINNQLPIDILDNLNMLVSVSRGKRLIVWDAFPQLFKDLSKTYEQMIEEGKIIA